MHTHTHTHIYIYMCVRACAYIYIHMCKQTYVFILTKRFYTYKNINVSVDLIGVCVYIYACVFTMYITCSLKKKHEKIEGY